MQIMQHPLVKELLFIAEPIMLFLAIMLMGLVIRRLIIARLSKWAGQTKMEADDIIIGAIKKPFLVWCALLALYLALNISTLPQEWMAISGRALLIIAIISVTFVIADIAGGLISAYSSSLSAALPVTTLTQNITRIIIFGVGVLVILNSLGISITPILATLGVGGLAVALALQETLSNLFAGFYVIVSRQVCIGDYVKLESGEEGYVIDINWRTTKIRMLPNNIVLVPNSKLTQTIITNYYLPEKEMAVLVNVGVHYDSDLKKVEKVTCETAREVMKEVAGGVAGFEPFIRYHTFGDSSISFTVILRAREFVDQYIVKHEFVKRLHERYKKEGIVIPYPIRAINYTQEKAG